MLKEQKCLVIGTGVSGIGATQLLHRMGAKVILFDGSEKVSVSEICRKLPEGIEVECYTGSLPSEIEHQIEQVVLSPGVPVDLPIVQLFHEKGIPIIGEIELGFLVEKGAVAAITGTNGKTTTTTLVGDIMKAALGEDKVFVVGNIGDPYTLEAFKTKEDTCTVAEISSFQLETVNTFKPKVSAILNITEDHLNRHYTMENYAFCKEKIAAKQSKDEICVLNYDNNYTREFANICPAKPVFFSSTQILEEGFFLKEGKICKSENGYTEEILDIHKDMNLIGKCNVENVMAAIAIAEGMGVKRETIRKVIKDFRAVEHRIEYVATKGGVDYYNDSKGTNPDAAIQGIMAMTKPTILIGGGYDKKNVYDEWIDNFDGKVKWLVLIGQTKELIAECARKHGFENIKLVDTFEQCLQLCTSLSEPGDSVLLSPACASWGMFTNYEERGTIFKQYVQNLNDE